MNGNKEKYQATDKPTTALAKAKAGTGSMHPVRRGTTTHKKSRRKVRCNPARIHEEKNRCKIPLQEFSKLSNVDLQADLLRLCRQRVTFWLGECGRELTLNTPSAYRRALGNLSKWQGFRLRLLAILASQSTSSNETIETPRRGPEHPANLPKTGKTEGRTKKTRVGVCAALDSGNVASAFIQAFPLNRRSNR